MKRMILLLLSVCLIFTVFCGCNGVVSGGFIQYEGDEMPETVDPLLADSLTERMAVQQLYEPLVTVQNGLVVPAAAEKYAVSDDQKTYTFYLRESLRWSDGKAVTAADFVFALQRAADPKTRAVCADRLTNIVGVSAVQAGKKSATEIGVTAQNAKTLVITLQTADDGILTVLSGPAGMPCRQDFFTVCGGRYGMGDEYVLTNGAFYISQWSTNEKDLYVTLRKNEHYWNQKQVLPAGVFLAVDDKTTRLTRMDEGKVDCIAVSGQELKSALEMGLQASEYTQSGYGLVFNTAAGRPTADLDLRTALVGGIDWAQLSAYLPSYFQATESIMMPDQFCGKTVYTSLPYREKTVQKADKAFASAVASADQQQIGQMELIYVEQDGVRNVLDFLVQCWQKRYGLFVTLTPVTSGDLQQRLRDKTFDMALCSMGSETKTTLETLEQFSSSAKGVFGGLAGKGYNALLKKAKTAPIGSIAEQQICENDLRNRCIVAPVYYLKGYYVYGEKIKDFPLSSAAGLPDFTRTAKSK